MSLDNSKRVQLAAPSITKDSFATTLTVPSGSHLDLYSAFKSYATSNSVTLPGYPLRVDMYTTGSVEIRTLSGSAGFPLVPSSSFSLSLAEKPGTALGQSVYLREMGGSANATVAVIAFF